jgi:hypothetical protein
MERQCVYCGVRTENGNTIYTKLMVERVEKIHTSKGKGNVPPRTDHEGPEGE